MNNSTDKEKRIDFLEKTVRRLLEERSKCENKVLMLENKLNAQKLKDEFFNKEMDKDKILSNQLGILIRPKIHEIKGALFNVEIIFKNLKSVKTEIDIFKLKKSLNVGMNSIEQIKRNILDLSCLGGKLPEELTKINIKALVKENVKFIQDCYTDFKIDLNLQDSPIEILGYRDSLNQIMNNLTRNAIEACTPSKGKITVIVKKDEENSHFFNLIFKDNGCGIQRNEIGKIYDLHYTTKKTGFGVGLYLVRNAVNLLKGKITCISDPNSGTTFTVTIPMKKEKNNDITKNSPCR